MSCEIERDTWQNADDALTASDTARTEASTTLDNANAAVVAAQEALAQAETAYQDAQVAYDNANAQVVADAIAADDAYTAYADCLANGGSEPEPALSGVLHTKYHRFMSR